MQLIFIIYLPCEMLFQYIIPIFLNSNILPSFFLAKCLKSSIYYILKQHISIQALNFQQKYIDQYLESVKFTTEEVVSHTQVPDLLEFPSNGIVRFYI